jgi:hypothetical protein
MRLETGLDADGHPSGCPAGMTPSMSWHPITTVPTGREVWMGWHEHYDRGAYWHQQRGFAGDVPRATHWAELDVGARFVMRPMTAATRKSDLTRTQKAPVSVTYWGAECFGVPDEQMTWVPQIPPATAAYTYGQKRAAFQ